MAAVKEIWDNCMAIMAAELNNPVSVNVWLKQIKPISINGEVAVLSVPTYFYWEIIKTKFGTLIHESLSKVLGFEVEVNLVIEEDLPQEEEERQPEKTTDALLIKPINEEYTFENYVVGNSNRLAHAACQAVANNPAKAYNPLFLYGESGLGKTHLMYSIINVVKSNHPEYSVLYVSCEDFTNELISSLRNASMEQFRNKYRDIDLLLVDDIQFIGGKEQTQEEFFHTFDYIWRSGKQIVIASDRPPKEIQKLTDRLRGRFESGLLADIQPPDYELRQAIIKKKAEALGLDLPDDVIDFLSNRLKNSVRQLEGALKKIHALNLISKTPPSIATAQSAVADILNENEPIDKVVDRIITEVGRYYSVSVDDMKSLKRPANISNARQIAMYIIRDITGLSLPEIGKFFAGKDHSTVHHAIKRVEGLIESNASVKNAISDIIHSVRKK